jgi:hypothetical protein
MILVERGFSRIDADHATELGECGFILVDPRPIFGCAVRDL